MLKCMFPLDGSHFNYGCVRLQLLIKCYAINIPIPRFVNVIMSYEL